MNREKVLDYSVVCIANAINLLLALLFIFRYLKSSEAESLIGLMVVSLAIPLLIISVVNAATRHEWWTYVLPLPLIAYCAFEFLLDYVYKYDFRSTWVIAPYLLIFYVGLMALIGFSFLVSRRMGFITLTTYFIQLSITMFVYMKVGH